LIPCPPDLGNLPPAVDTDSARAPVDLLFCLLPVLRRAIVLPVAAAGLDFLFDGAREGFLEEDLLLKLVLAALLVSFWGFAADLFTTCFLAIGFLPICFLRAPFFATGLFATGFLLIVFFAIGLLTVGFLAAALLAAGFFAATFFTTGLLIFFDFGAGFLGFGFFGTGFFATFFFDFAMDACL
jgi:hypothetical protein